ncbi:MAG: hypothetical protein ACT4OM_01315 [Actinomycetota bacterium]
MNEEQRIGMLRIMQAVIDTPDTALEAVRSEMRDMPDQWEDLVWMLKMSRLIDVTEGDPGEGGRRTIASINGLTTRGLRELQRSYSPPQQVHSCPTDGNDGHMGFMGGA